MKPVSIFDKHNFKLCDLVILGEKEVERLHGT
jgi:hypothetical protein